MKINAYSHYNYIIRRLIYAYILCDRKYYVAFCIPFFPDIWIAIEFFFQHIERNITCNNKRKIEWKYELNERKNHLEHFNGIKCELNENGCMKIKKTRVFRWKIETKERESEKRKIHQINQV